MLNLQKYIKENFGFAESQEIMATFEKHNLHEELEHVLRREIKKATKKMTRSVVCQLQDIALEIENAIDDLEEND